MDGVWNLLVALVVGTALLSGACRARREISRPGYIVGPTNDIERLPEIEIEEIDVPPKVLRKAIKASVLTVTVQGDGKRKYCSGSLIGGRSAGDTPRIITNHHCFAEKRKGSDRSLPHIIPEACENTTVYFSFEDDDEDSKPLSRKCRRGSLVTNFDADFALFSLDKPLPAEYEPFEIWDGKVPPNRPAFIIHHPSAKESRQGGESEAMLREEGVYLPKKAITVKNCRVLGPFDKNFWSLNPNLSVGLKHTCDLVQGSSGSGLIDVTSGKLLGVNWGGITLTINKSEHKHNVASAAQFLRQFVASHDVTAPPMPPQARDSIACAHIAGHTATDKLLLFLLFIPPLVAARQRSDGSKRMWAKR